MGLLDNSISDDNISLYSGVDGSSPESAVVLNTTRTSIGVPAEYEYLSKKYGTQDVDWFMIQQKLLMHANSMCDALFFRLSSGEEKVIFFDITRFFGSD
jgi:hypothetical protein